MLIRRRRSAGEPRFDAAASPSGGVPSVEVGRISGELVSRQLADAARELAEPARASDFLAITVPVTIRLVGEVTRSAELAVAVDLHAPSGQQPPVAFDPSPSTEYLDLQEARSGSVAFKPAVLEFRGGVDRSASRKQVVRDVAGAGSSHVQWRTVHGLEPLAGSHEFRFLVRRDEAVYGWLEVKAELCDVRAPWARNGAEARSAVSIVPLVADTAPQASATLTLRDDVHHDAHPLFVGRPLDLPLFLGAQGLSIGQRVGGASAVGSLRWFDDVNGESGFVWVQRSRDPVAVDGEPESHFTPGTSVFLGSGSVLRFGPELCVSVGYDTRVRSGRATLRESLELELVVDGQTVSSHTVISDYVTVGRKLRDVCIDRPDISRSHGVLEHGRDGWAYTHKSAVTRACVRRGDAIVARLCHDDAVLVNPGDVIELTRQVSLVLK